VKNNHSANKFFSTTDSKDNFWFRVTIYLWVLIIIASFFLILGGEENWATKISTYGGGGYFILLPVISLILRKKYPLISQEIIKGVKMVFLFWLIFIIIFGLSFIIGFKIS